MGPARIGRAFTCGCFLKVYVCPGHLEVAREELKVLTSQLQLPILDRVSSVSDLRTEDGDAVRLG